MVLSSCSPSVTQWYLGAINARRAMGEKDIKYQVFL
jgi:hypothetical protein